MLDILLVILAVLAVAVLAALAIAAMKPNAFRVDRSIDIEAPAAKIFPLLNDLRGQAAWSPWDQKDPTMKRTYSGAESGKGAVYVWDGNKDIGSGRQEIVETTPHSDIKIKMDFIRPFEAHNMVEFLLRPQGNATNVTWAISGPMPFMFRVMSLFCTMDKMIGKEFDTGLANLKTLVEGR